MKKKIPTIKVKKQSITEGLIDFMNENLPKNVGEVDETINALGKGLALTVATFYEKYEKKHVSNLLKCLDLNIKEAFEMRERKENDRH